MDLSYEKTFNYDKSLEYELDRALNIIEESIVEYLNGQIPDEVLDIAKGW